MHRSAGRNCASSWHPRQSALLIHGNATFPPVPRLTRVRLHLRLNASRDVLADDLRQLWELIGSTKARTLAGARVQIECVAEQLVTGVSGGAERERTALANAAATLDRLAAAA